LTKLNDAASGGDGSPHLSVHPSGKWVLVAHYGSGQISSLKIDTAGALSSPPADLQKPAATTTHQILTDASGKYVFVCNVNANTIFQFKFDDTTGKFTDNGSVPGLPAKAGPRHMAFHPTKPWAYSINETATSVSMFNLDAATGKLSAGKTITSLPAGVSNGGKVTGAHVVVHPNGKFVFSSNRGHNSISVFSIADDGELTLASNETAVGAINNPRDFDVDEFGKFLVVANQEGNSATVLQIDSATGKLSAKSSLSGLQSPTFVGILYPP
jgi:6-phosphogluconolactonase